MALPRLILDSGGLSALAAGERRAIAWAYRATARGLLFGIPAPVLAETMTGRPQDAKVHRVISTPNVVLETTGDIARDAGAIRFRANAPDQTIDALVIATAATFPGSTVLTSDPHDLTQLASFRPNARLHIRDVNSPSPKK